MLEDINSIRGAQGEHRQSPLGLANALNPSNSSNVSSLSNVSLLPSSDVAGRKRIGLSDGCRADGRRLETRKVQGSPDAERIALQMEDFLAFSRSIFLMQAFLRMMDESVRLRGETVKRYLKIAPATAKDDVREIRTLRQKIVKAFDGFDGELQKQLAALRKDAKLTARQKAAAKRLEAQFREWQIQVSGFKARQERLRKEAREGKGEGE